MGLYRLADKLISLSFYFLLFTVPLVFSPVNSELFELPKIVLTYVLTVVITSSWAIKSIASGRLIFRRTPLDFFLLGFLVSQFLSFSVSVDPHTSLWGYYSRSHGGLLSTISYMLLYWAFVSNMDYKKTLSSIFYLLSSATIVALWGVLEHFGLSPSCLILGRGLTADCWVQDVQTRVFASLGQPNWMAAWLVALSPIVWALALNSKLKNQQINSKNWNAKLQFKVKNFIWLGISALFFLALLYTKSRSGLLGFAGAYVVFWGIVTARSLATKQSQRLLRFARNDFILLSILYSLLILLAGSPWTPSLNELAQNVPITNNAITNNYPAEGTALERGGTESGEIRKIVWSGAIDAWRAYPLFGSGVETFAYVYYQFRPVEHNLTSEWDFLYNKAHNEFLNYLATTGTVGFLAYITLIVAFLAWVIRMLANPRSAGQRISTNMRMLVAALGAGYTSILITNFFGFSVVPVATLFFLFPAMAIAISQNRKQKTESIKLKQLSRKQIIGIIFAFCFLLFALARLSVLWYADVLYARAKEQNRTGEVGVGIENAQQALRLRPDEPNYWDELAQGTALMAASLALDEQLQEAGELAEVADEASSKALEISPRNISILKSRAVIMNQLATVDEKYFYEGINTLEKARILAPTEPKIHYNLGVLYSRVGQVEQAEKLLQKALELKPDYQDPKEALKTLQKG